MPEETSETNVTSETIQGEVLPNSTPSSTFISITNSSSSDQSKTLGHIEEKLVNVEKRLEKIEGKLEDIDGRLKGIETVFIILEGLPKVGTSIKALREASRKK